jgi:hypothetical protein
MHFFQVNSTSVGAHFVVFRKGDTGAIRLTSRPYFSSGIGFYSYTTNITTCAASSSYASVNAAANSSTYSYPGDGYNNSQYNMLIVEQVTKSLPKWGMMVVFLSQMVATRRPSVILMAGSWNSYLYH